MVTCIGSSESQISHQIKESKKLTKCVSKIKESKKLTKRVSNIVLSFFFFKVGISTKASEVIMVEM